MTTKRNYLTNEEFVERFSASLLRYLNDTIPSGDSKNHLQDLVAHTGVFTEVFWRVVSDF
jgi:hypothetical protein